MTNSPTIYGVSRELLADLVKIASRNVRSAWSGGICEEARALLDAPVFEPTNDLREHCKQCAEVVKTWPEWKQNCLGGAPVVERQQICGQHTGDSCESCGGSGTVFQLGFMSLDDGSEEPCPDCTAPPEVAALQSTIAQLQARIAELESGRGEPVAWRHTMHFEEGFGSQSKISALPENAFGKPGVDYDEMFKVTCEPLYTAPPAPVAQKLGEPTAYLRNEGVPNNLVVCAFDHPDAFKVFRVPPAPVAVVLPERATDSNCAEIMQRIGLYGRVNVWHGGKIWNACLDAATAALNEGRK